MLFGAGLVFFARRWSIQWNKQIDSGMIPDGDGIDKNVCLLTQMLFSVIPFLNFTAFARIYHFRRAVVIGLPTYLLMIIPTSLIIQIQSNSSLFYPVYITLTSSIFAVFMYCWTTKYNAGKCNKWYDTWKDVW
ncbi:MAG: hypothetical protein M3162_01700 [Thermoproteota archaeon]|nr:hypothetical protein [Thermoproteota archaeon]